jgi:cell division inhibitor SepF
LALKLFDKVWNMLGLVEADEPVEEKQVKTNEKTSSRPDRKTEHSVERSTERMNKPTVEIKPAAKSVAPAASTFVATSEKGRIVLTQPEGFDDSRQIAEHLTNGKLVVVNFERTDAETTKRTIDFMSGITYAVGGTVQRVSATIFLFAPSTVEVLSNDRFVEQEQTLMSWRGNKQGRDQ